ncbi:hypothetical protein [Natronomonas sp.]|uniref:hypothetical protein n=1 Tax=Natronomonas sp. TaxID=2184060 RepID=UPI002FC2F8DF
MQARGRPLSLWLLILLLGQLSVRAFVGGGALLVAPSSTLVGLPTEPLESTPFSDFFVPGLVLLPVFGLLPAGVCYGLYANRVWAWPAAVTVSVALLLWIIVEIAVGLSRPTIYLNLGTAIGIGGVAMYPAVRRDLRSTTA